MGTKAIFGKNKFKVSIFNYRNRKEFDIVHGKKGQVLLTIGRVSHYIQLGRIFRHQFARWPVMLIVIEVN